MQRTLPPDVLRDRSILLTNGAEHDPNALLELLPSLGYELTVQAREKRQAARKGGILDVWPPDATWPFRIEFYGAVIESIRTFDPADQKSLGKAVEAHIPPATEWNLHDTQAHSRTGQSAQPASLLSYLSEGATFLWSDEDAIGDHAVAYEEIIAESENTELMLPFSQVRRAMERIPDCHHLVFCANPAAEGSPAPELLADPLGFQAVRGDFDAPRTLLLPDFYARLRNQILDDMRRRADKGHTVFLLFDTAGALDHFRSDRRADSQQAPPALHADVGMLSEGFVSDTLGMAVVAESDLYGRQKRPGRRYEPQPDRPGPARLHAARIADLTDIEPGDLVVHVEHGIGKHLGLREIRVNNRLQEVLTIEYADAAKLHVPVSQAHLLSRYVGLSKTRAALHRLGGNRWNKEKTAAEVSIMDLSASLLETQAERSLQQGYAFKADTTWQRDFEASFPYRETPDQHAAVSAVKTDMQSARPMDRLVCGDAGYGKTEVAMRAAFKAALEGRQTAVLVPTTVLAQQHFDTFRERMAAFPLRVEMLSRFCSRSRQADIVNGLTEGAIDIVIGTHALLQPDVRFKDLGLVIIDEEQRFGVRHKEWFKQMRRLVDVITLTATPIPRTLYLSLMGARDMSLIQTAPRERMAIETIVASNSDDVIRDAILREIGRDGQVFHIHNRVMTIANVKTRLARVVPEARVEIAHGQMASSDLARTMRRFVAGEFNTLLCTTIVESGVDIPRANTILIIDRADRFGIADLYQLRGRVGRSHHKAYAYLLLPTDAPIDPDARRRINAVRKFSHLSVGFKLALRDLEIRGAGNLLGAAQSGHIAAIGFDLYCRLLKRTIAFRKGEPVPPIVDVDLRLEEIVLAPDAADSPNSAAIPYGYIEDESLRIAVYRRIAEATAPAELDALRAELADRFGPPPPAVERLLQTGRIRALAAARGIRQVETRGSRLILLRGDEFLKKGALFPRLHGAAPADRLAEIIRHLDTL
ncbi:MAG: transcription-repair coupling factor [Verrucomicrobiota bacterium]|nr:transcription-repair coupling factor [Verrucomicrobiota bacterium]